MGSTIMWAVVSLDGYIARTDDEVGPLFADTAPFTFATGGVAAAIARAREFAGDRIVDVGAGEIGGQALRLGLVDQVVMNVVPVVFGAGRPFFGAMGPGDVMLANPSRVVQGDRVTHLLYDVAHTTPQEEE